MAILSNPQALAARDAKREAAEEMGITPDFIADMVDRFYGKVRADPMLGPIFAGRVTDWPVHLGRMRAFWGSVLHQSGGFNGNPMQKHAAIPGIGMVEFRRWLALFADTLDEMEEDARATDAILGKAHTIADSLLIGIRIHRDKQVSSNDLKGLEHV